MHVLQTGQDRLLLQVPREKTQKHIQTIVIILNADPDGYNRSRYKVGGDCVKLKYIMGENVKLCTKIEAEKKNFLQI